MKAELDDALRAQIYGWAYRLLRNHHEALDATQDVLLKWVAGRWGEVDNRRAWLRRATVNHCLDRLRGRRAAAPLATGPAQTTTPLRQVEENELRARVTRALTTLTDMQRAVLVAKVYDRETFAAIAAAMHTSVSTAKTHYVRALRTLRCELADLDLEALP